MSKKGIRHETTIRYTPQQNGVSERDNRTIIEGGRTLLYSNKSLPLSLWAEAVSCFIYTLNRALSTTCPVKTPFESWYGRKPNVSNLRTFGSEFYVLIPKEKRRKLDPKGLLCIFVGNCDTQKGDRYWDPTTGKVNISRDVTPIDHHYAPRISLADNQHGIDVFSTVHLPPEPISHHMDTNPVIQKSVPIPAPTGEDAVNILPPMPPPRRSTRERKQKKFVSMVAHHGDTPDHYRDVEFSTNASDWMAATQKEYDALIKNGTWQLVKLPPNRSLIKSRWTFRLKPGYKTTEPTIYKARFVAKGFSQEPGVDYNEAEIYAPVVKADSLRVLLSIAGALDLELSQLDVKTAFLHGDLDEELYIEQPEGFIQPGEEDLVCLLKKPLYGLKQASRKWNEKFDSFLTEFGLIRSTADPCVYFYRGEELGDVTILGIWVDDGLLATKTKERARAIIKYLETHFEMTSRLADHFIGLEITRDRSRRQIFVSQTNFIQTLLERFRMTGCNPSSVPADPDSRLSVTSSPKYRDPLKSTPYRAAIGGLMYVAKMTRPDVLFALIAASRYCENPGKAHWEAVERILSYLSGTMDYGLCFGGTSSDNLLIGYSDSDFAGCPDTRRSTSGLLFILNGGPIAWSSHLQKPVAQSTSEAEYYAAGHASREIVWLRELLNQLGFQQSLPTSLMCDNNSTIMMVLNPVFHERTKHIGIKYHFIRQQHLAKNIEMVSVPTDDELADILTKPLGAIKFRINRSRIGVLPVPQN